MKKIQDLLGYWSTRGVDMSHETDVSRRIVFTNIIFLSLPVVYLIFMIIDYQSYLVPVHSLRFDQFVVPIIILVCYAGVYLNHIGLIILSRILFLLLWPILLHVIPIILLNTPPDYYLAFPFGVVFHGMLVQLMISFRKEPIVFTLFMVINLTAVVYFPSFLVLHDVDLDLPNGLVTDKYYWFDDGVLYWLLFNLVTFYVLYTIDIYIDRMNKARILIEEQKEELRVLNENLERMVTSRTLVLQKQNQKLQEYAFYNAHILRGPFCRIKGLVMLMELSATDEDRQELKIKLAACIEELEIRIREIQLIVHTEGEVRNLGD